jgi:serine/threonine protein kinase
MKQLDHPNIVKYYGSVADSDYSFIIMELCQGGSLNKYKA